MDRHSVMCLPHAVLVSSSIVAAVGPSVWMAGVRDRTRRTRLESLEKQMNDIQRDLTQFRLDMEVRLDAMGDDVRLRKK